MGAESLKIIDFDATPNKKEPKPEASPNGGVVAELRALSARHLGLHMQRLFAVLDDELFKLSGMAKSNDEQNRYFEAMRYLRLEAGAIRERYVAAVLRGYDEARKPAPTLRPESGELALVEEHALEEDLAITGMAGKANNLYARELYALNARFAALLGRDALSLELTPCAPQALCRALADAFGPVDFELSFKLLAYKLYEQVVLGGLGEWYHELDGRLREAGLLPELTPRRPVAPGVSRPRSPVGRKDGEGEGFDDSHALYMEAFSMMENLLGTWRERMGPATQFSGPAFPVAEVLNALNVLQNPVLLGGFASAEAMKPHLRQQLGQPRPFGRREEDIIDMVSMLFEFILADRGLPEEVKTLISRLQIPVIKVAIIERSLLGRKNHPVRLLLNALAQAGIGLDASEAVTETPVFKRIEAVVHRVLDEFDQNVALFSELLDDFTAFMQKENQRSGVAEERARQATQSKEQLQVAKQKVAYEIALRVQGHATPAAVRSFLFNIWKDVLILGYLRRDKAPGDWENSLAVMDKLIWSVTVTVDHSSRLELIKAIPSLLKAIKNGMDALSLDPQTVATALDELRVCHIARLPKIDGTEAKRVASATAQPRKIEIRDPELAKAIVEIRGNLPDVENFGIADLAALPEGNEARHPGVDDALLAKLRQLPIGEWVELEEGGKKIRAKLSWKSQITTAYVFVNRKGGKIAELPLLELARRFAEGQARIIEGSHVPLMDRALHGLMSKLRGQVGGEPLLDAV